MPIKFNPFKPRGIAPPGIFAGRVDEIETIATILRQTKNGNPRHFLLTGERGIGKSSLLVRAQGTAEGRIPAADGESFNFITVSISLLRRDTYEDILQRVGTEFRRAVAAVRPKLEKAKQALEFFACWEVGGVRYVPSSDGTAQFRWMMQLVDDIAGTLDRMGDAVDGVVVLIDEADSPPAGSSLGGFVKQLTEELTRAGCHRQFSGSRGCPVSLRN